MKHSELTKGREGRYAGELGFKKGMWIADNESGRFSINAGKIINNEGNRKLWSNCLKMLA